MAEADFDEELFNNCGWMQCLECFEYAKDDRNMMILSCSHAWCSSCFKKLKRNADGKVSCPCCKKDGKHIRLFSKKLPAKMRELLMPCSFAEELAAISFRQQIEATTTERLVADIARTQAQMRAQQAKHEKVEKDTARMEKENADARARLFRDFSDEEFAKIMSMTVEELDEFDIGRKIDERQEAMKRRDSTSSRTSSKPSDRRESTSSRKPSKLSKAARRLSMTMACRDTPPVRRVSTTSTITSKSSNSVSRPSKALERREPSPVRRVSTSSRRSSTNRREPSPAQGPSMALEGRDPSPVRRVSTSSRRSSTNRRDSPPARRVSTSKRH